MHNKSPSIFLFLCLCYLFAWACLCGARWDCKILSRGDWCRPNFCASPPCFMDVLGQVRIHGTCLLTSTAANLLNYRVRNSWCNFYMSPKFIWTLPNILENRFVNYDEATAVLEQCRKRRNNNGTINFEIDIMKKSYLVNLELAFLPLSKSNWNWCCQVKKQCFWPSKMR